MVCTKYVRFPPKHYPPGIQGDRNPLGTPFSSIFRRAAKDGAPGGRRFRREVGKKRAAKDGATGGRWFRREVGKKRTAKDGAPGGRIEKRMSVNT